MKLLRKPRFRKDEPTQAFTPRGDFFPEVFLFASSILPATWGLSRPLKNEKAPLHAARGLFDTRK